MAAISVLLGHFIGMQPVIPRWMEQISNSPMHILWDGAAAVNLFFVLSGFCVALPYMRKKNPRSIEYLPFLIRRVFRLYPAYAVALLLCLVAKFFYICPNLDGISAWGREFWQWQSLAYSQWLALAGMIYHADTKLLDPPTWSLVVEMKMAFILPIMFLVYRRLAIFFQFVLTFFLLLIMLIYGSSLNYACHFGLGIMIAKERDFIADKVADLSKRQLSILLLAGIFFYTCRWPWKEMLIGWIGISYSVNMLFEILNGLGSALLIMIFFHPSIANRLSNSLGCFLGEISYSIYLLHFPILLLCVSYLQNWYISFVVLLSVSIVSSWLMFRFVEKPMIGIGRKVSELVEIKWMQKLNNVVR